MARIILAEDDLSLRKFISSSLEKAGHNVLAFSDGAQAFESLKSAPCDLLLTDIVMPEMDGLELSARASKLYPTLDIIFITGFAASLANIQNDPTKTTARIISKPFHLGKLIQEINDILAKKQIS